MNRLAYILVAGAFAFGMSGAALAQTTSPAHQQHSEPPAAAQPASPHEQHRGQGHQQQGEHGEDCRCCCCRMMMEMMRRHGMHQPGAADQPDGHQQHQDERPN